MYSAYKLNKQGDNIQPWRTPFPLWNQSVVVPCPVLTVASWPGYRFLRRAGQVVLYSDLFKNFPHFVVIHTVKGFDIVNKADVFLELSCLFYDPAYAGNLISAFSAFSKSNFQEPGSSRFMYYWSLAWRISSTTFLACEMSAIVQEFVHSLTLPFFGIGMKTDLFQSCGHCWVFQIFWHIECSTLAAASFRIWNSSTGIPSASTSFDHSDAS